MTAEHAEVRPGAYADSVTLMQVSRSVGALPGVGAVLVAMATELNLGLLDGMGLPVPSGASANDLIVAVRAEDETSLAAALSAVDDALSARRGATGGGAGGAVADQPPRTVGLAARDTGPALVLVSVPGQHAFTEAIDALESGCDVMIFSDNVSVEQEIALKEAADERGLLVMGPDCGTAVVGGVGLGFSHSLAPGPVGVVAASGTGAQQVLCLLDAAGVGVSAALGVGGRDLSADVGGRSTRAALRALDADPTTDLIIVISKPPADAVAAEIRRFADTLGTPVEFALIGGDRPDLTAATEHALRRLGVAVPRWPSWPGRAGEPRAGWLRGLFAGGTLCDEAMTIAALRFGAVYSNIPLQPDWLIDPRDRVDAHLMIDFGDDELTRGRPHPMIDQTLRLERFAAEAADERTAVLLLDVVLGHGAHLNPAAEIAAAIRDAPAELPVVVSVIGARADPQDISGQARILHDAGAHVFTSNAEAARFACDLVVATE
jgi:FdrA protein